MIVCAGNGEYFAFAKSIGIGLCESTIGLMQICMRECIDSIVFVGSAGAYSKDINIGDVIHWAKMIMFHVKRLIDIKK